MIEVPYYAGTLYDRVHKLLLIPCTRSPIPNKIQEWLMHTRVIGCVMYVHGVSHVECEHHMRAYNLGNGPQYHLCLHSHFISIGTLLFILAKGASD